MLCFMDSPDVLPSPLIRLRGEEGPVSWGHFGFHMHSHIEATDGKHLAALPRFGCATKRCSCMERRQSPLPFAVGNRDRKGVRFST